MSILNYYYKHIVRQDLLTKFSYANCLEIPQLKKIVLRFNVSQSSLKNLLPSITGLLLISSQKPSLVISKKINITLKIKSGSAVSCKVDLRAAEKYFFLEKIIFLVLPRLKGFHYRIQQKNVNFKIDNIFLFKELEKEYEYFQDLPKLNINLFFKARTLSEIAAFLTAIKFPVRKNTLKND